MSYAQDTGYTPVPFSELMDGVRTAVNNTFGTDYTEATFVGTNWYKYSYLILQMVQQNETKTAEIFAKLQEYIATTNDRIQRPSTSLPGLVDSFADAGYTAAVKRNAVEDAGTVSVCVDVDDGADDYADTKVEICTLLKDFVAAGMVFTGDQEEEITLSNGQAFDFAYHLPDKTPILLRLTLVTSPNQDLFVPDDEAIRQVVFDNINARYRLGWNFEPQRYFTQVDAPWAATILLEYSVDDGENWTADVFEAEFTDLLTFGEEEIDVIVDPEP